MMPAHQKLTRNLLVMAGVAACRQAVPGVHYGVMAGKAEEDHLELAGKASDLAVLPATIGCFSGRKTGLSRLLLFSLLLLPPGRGSLAGSPFRDLWPLMCRMSHDRLSPHSNTLRSVSGAWVLRFGSSLGGNTYLFEEGEREKTLI